MPSIYGFLKQLRAIRPSEDHFVKMKASKEALTDKTSVSVVESSPEIKRREELKSHQKIEEGAIIQENNTLSIMTLDKEGKLVPFKLSDNADSVTKLFPSGIHELTPAKLSIPGLEQFWSPSKQNTQAENLKEFINLIQVTGHHPAGTKYEIKDRTGKSYKFAMLRGTNEVVRGGKPIENGLKAENTSLKSDPGHRMLQFAIAEKKGSIPDEFWGEH
jgi:hypothetical protein